MANYEKQSTFYFRFSSVSAYPVYTILAAGGSFCGGYACSPASSKEQMGAIYQADYRAKWYKNTLEQAQTNLPEQFDNGTYG